MFNIYEINMGGVAKTNGKKEISKKTNTNEEAKQNTKVESAKKNNKKKETRNIKQIIIAIWSNIKFLRILSVIATLISLILGGKEVYLILDDYKTNKLINKLGDTSLELNNGDREFCRSWLNDVEKFKDKPKFWDSYNFFKGMGLSIAISKDPIYNTELPPNYYLRKVSSESKFYNDAIIFRCLDVTVNSPDSLICNNLKDLIKELDKANYQTPRFYFVKYVYALYSRNLDTLFYYYNDMKERYMDSPSYNNNEYIHDVIKLRDNKMWDLTQVQTLEYLYNIEILRSIRFRLKNMNSYSQEYIIKLKEWKIMCKNYLSQINQLPDIQLGFLRGGFNAFQCSNPLFPPGLHIKMFFNETEWFKYQRIYLSSFLDLE